MSSSGKLKSHGYRSRWMGLIPGLATVLLFVSNGIYAADSADQATAQSATDSSSASATIQPDPWEVKAWRVQTSILTHHWSYNPEHNDTQKLINVEAVFENNWLAGVARFDNSFGQPSGFLYMGHEWPLFHSKYFYWKLVGGLLYGYKDEYKDKIPLNGNELAPAILPIVGARYKWFFTELDIAGGAAFTWTAGVQF